MTMHTVLHTIRAYPIRYLSLKIQACHRKVPAHFSQKNNNNGHRSFKKKRLFPLCNNWIAIAFTYTLGINVDASIANLAQYPNDISFAIKLQYFMEWMNPYFWHSPHN